MGKHFAYIIPDSVYDRMNSFPPAIPFGALFIEDFQVDISNCIIFSNLDGIDGTSFCVVKPLEITFKDWKAKHSFLVKCI